MKQALDELLLGQRHRIGRRLILQIIAFSSLITLLVSAAQLAFEYQELRRDMDHSLDSVVIHVPSITSSVWDFDEKQLQLSLDALARLPNVSRVVVRSADGVNTWRSGQSAPANVVLRSYSLRQAVRGKDREIGTLEVAGSLNSIYRQVASHALTIVLGNAFKTFLVVVFMVLLLRRLITRRLEALAKKVSELVPRMLPLRQAVQTDPPPMPDHLDELDAVAWALDNTARDLNLAVDELHRLNEGLEQRVQERTQDLRAFSYTLSHDLKAPLLTISNFSGMLQAKHSGQLDEQGRRHLARIQAAAQRMDAIVVDTLRLCHASAAPLVVQPVDLSRLAQDIADDLARSQPERGVEWDIEQAMQTDGDAQLLRIALENLLGNAWKYTGRRDCARIRIGSFTQPDGMRGYFVEDNGAGFDMAHAGQLFEPFIRLHQEAEFPGNGVGLATVRKIAQRHGGTIWAQAEADRGATFFFTLGPGPVA